MKDQVRTPLRTVLRNFLNHIEKLESSNCPEKSYDAEFQDLKFFSESIKVSKEYASGEGEKDTNRKKNRYKDILPFDVSRVILNEYASIPGSDYINANYIKGASGSPAYIASQGPLPCTVNDFWRMVVQCEVQVIVMACNEEEAGKAKCEKYWVDEGEEKQFGMISVKLLKASTVCPDFSVRTMRLKYTTSQNVVEERTVCQLHYVAWPDHGVPMVVQPLLEMVRLVRDTQASETLPVLVHCSAGCGRTGTICAIDYVWGLLRTGKLTDDFSLLALIREMRRQRIAMVQTKEQYVLVHQAVRELFKEQLLMIDSHPYENVDPDGLLIIKEEENHYDVVETIANINIEEKKDNTMEKDVAPPLPQKKFTFYPSKQEKDVENLSAQQRSIIHSTKTTSHSIPSVSSNSSPRSSISTDGTKPLQQMLHALQKKLSNPIPSKGILRVPHLKSISSTTPIKRSKSLKLTNSGFKQNVAVASTVLVEVKRRGSLESNIDETPGNMGDGGFSSVVSTEDLVTAKNGSGSGSTTTYSPSHAIKKYDMLNYLEEKRLLVRSLTTFDMRQSTTAPSIPIEERSAVKMSGRSRLSRSNTQIEFSKFLGDKAQSKKIGTRTELEMRSPSKKQSAPEAIPLALFISQSEVHLQRHSERLQKSINKDRVEDVYQSVNGNCDVKYPVSQSTFEKGNSRRASAMRNEVPMYLMDTSKDQKVGSCNGHANKPASSDQRVFPNVRSLGPSIQPYSRDPKLDVFQGNRKSSAANDVQFLGYSSPSTSRNFEPNGKPVMVNKHSFSQPYHNGMALNDGLRKFSYLNGSPLVVPLKHEYRDRKPDPKGLHPSQMTNSKDYCGPNPHVNPGSMHPEYRTSFPSHLKSSTAGAPSHYGFADKTAISRKPIENPGLMSKRGTHSPRTKDERLGIDVSCASSPQVQDVGSNHFKATSSSSTRPWPPTYQLSEQIAHANDMVEFEHNKKLAELSGQKNGGHSSRAVDVTATKESGVRKCDYFSNAPGVDIDQVAASIPQKDGSKTNLMKVALEAFSTRRSRKQAHLPDSSASTSSSSKGSSPSSTIGGGKRRQQQYL